MNQSEFTLLELAFGIVIDELNTQIEDADKHSEAWRHDAAVPEALTENAMGYARGLRFAKERIKSLLEDERGKVADISEPIPGITLVEPPALVPAHRPQEEMKRWVKADRPAPPPRKVTTNGTGDEAELKAKISALAASAAVTEARASVALDGETHSLGESAVIEWSDELNEAEHAGHVIQNRVNELLPFLKANPNKWAVLLRAHSSPASRQSQNIAAKQGVELANRPYTLDGVKVVKIHARFVGVK